MFRTPPPDHVIELGTQDSFQKPTFGDMSLLQSSSNVTLRPRNRPGLFNAFSPALKASFQRQIEPQAPLRSLGGGKGERRASGGTRITAVPVLHLASHCQAVSAEKERETF